MKKLKESLIALGYSESDFVGKNLQQLQQMLADETGTATATAKQVQNWHRSVSKRSGKKAGFVNTGLSVPAGSLTLERVFISNKEKAAGKTVENASEVYGSLRLVSADGNSKTEFADSMNNLNSVCAEAGKSLYDDEGNQIPVDCSIEAGKYIFA